MLESISISKRTTMRKSNDSQLYKSHCSVQQNPIVECPACNEDHYLNRCDHFNKLDIGSRRRLVVDKKLCFNCLSKNHQIMKCRSKFNCKLCSKRHHKLLYQDFKEREIATTATTQVATSTHVLLAMAKIKVVGRNGAVHRLRALIDQGSSVAHPSILQEVKLTCKSWKNGLIKFSQ